MNNKGMRLAGVAAVTILITLAGTAQAGRIEELRGRFEQRYAAIQELKVAGKLGETFQGYVEVVQKQYLDDARIKQLFTDENSDRGELYRLIASQTGVTPEDVAARNAARNFRKAQPGEYLKHADGVWRKKG